MDETRLREKLAKIEALLAGATTPGEKAAAANARQRIVDRLEELKAREPPEEHRFAIEDPYSRALFIALTRRYGLAPYRRRGQRKQSIMVRAPPTFVKTVLYPEFVELADTLHEQLAKITQDVIARVVHKDTSDTEEEPPAALGPGKRDGEA